MHSKNNKKSKRKSEDEFLNEEFDFSQATKRPAIHLKKTKVHKSFRIDADVFAWLNFKAEEEGLPYQTFMNSLLRKAMNVDMKPEMTMGAEKATREEKHARMERLSERIEYYGIAKKNETTARKVNTGKK